jgi:hypothetical protein
MHDIIPGFLIWPRSQRSKFFYLTKPLCSPQPFAKVGQMCPHKTPVFPTAFCQGRADVPSQNPCVPHSLLLFPTAFCQSRAECALTKPLCSPQRFAEVGRNVPSQNPWGEHWHLTSDALSVIIHRQAILWLCDVHLSSWLVSDRSADEWILISHVSRIWWSWHRWCQLFNPLKEFIQCLEFLGSVRKSSLSQTN